MVDPEKWKPTPPKIEKSLSCPRCNSHIKSDGRSVWCGTAPCEWSSPGGSFAKSLQGQVKELPPEPEPEEKAFSIGDTVHPKNPLLRPVRGLEGTVKEPFAGPGDALRIVAAFANGTVEVERPDGQQSTFAPGLFQEFGSKSIAQDEAEKTPHVLAFRRQARQIMLNPDGGNAQIRWRAVQMARDRLKQALIDGGMKRSAADEAARDIAWVPKWLLEGAHRYLQDFQWWTEIVNREYPAKSLEKAIVPENVRNAVARVKNWLMGKLKARYGDRAAGIIAKVALLSAPVPIPGSQPLAVALSLLVAEVAKMAGYAGPSKSAPQDEQAARQLMEEARAMLERELGTGTKEMNGETKAVPRLTDRQRQILRRIYRDKEGQQSIDPDVAKQLIAKGLIWKLGEWRRSVSGGRNTYDKLVTLWVVALTEEGKRVAKEMFDQPGTPEQKGLPGEDCPHCGASMERGDDGNCNRCGKLWPQEDKAFGQRPYYRVVVRWVGGRESVHLVNHSGDYGLEQARQIKSNYADLPDVVWVRIYKIKYRAGRQGLEARGEEEVKDLSANDTLSGGALVPPPAFAGKKRRKVLNPPRVKSIGLTKSVDTALASFRRLHGEIEQATKPGTVGHFDKARLAEFDREVDALKAPDLRQLAEQIGIYTGFTKQKVKDKLRRFLEALENLRV